MTTSYPYAYTKLDHGFGIALDSQGNLWFAQSDDDQVGVFSPATDISVEEAVQATRPSPTEIAQGPGRPSGSPSSDRCSLPGNKIGTIDSGTGQITQTSLPTAGAQPFGIVVRSGRRELLMSPSGL